MLVKVAAQLHEPQSGEENAPSLVILHGLFGSAGNWRSLSRQLASEHAVHALDLRNHGVSPHHDLMTYAEMAGDIVQYLDENVGDAPILMGHSMGGKAAMRLALSHGGRLSKLVVVDIAPVPNQHDFDHLLQAMSLIDTKTIRGRGEADKALAERVVDPPLRQFLLQNLVRDDTGYRWRINLEAIRANMDAILDFPIPDDWQAFEQPTLFIRGEQSAYVRSEHHKTIRELFPNAKIVTIADAGHWLHAEQPQRFLDAVLSFLES